MKTRKILSSILFFVGLILLWQLLYVAGTDWFSLVKPYAVPHPLGVWQSLCRLLADGTLLTAVGYSLMRAFIGFLIAIVVG